MILAIDPSYTNYGCSLISSTGYVFKVGVIKTSKSKTKLLRVADDDVQRISYITQQLSKIIHKFKVQGVVGELPPSNSQSAKAAKGLAMVVGLSVALFTELSLPVEWATPTEVKKAVTGYRNASKEQMMKAIAKRHSWKITTKPIYSKTKKLLREDLKFHVLGEVIGKSKFEHIADSLGAYEALNHTNLVKMYIKK